MASVYHCSPAVVLPLRGPDSVHDVKLKAGHVALKAEFLVSYYEECLDIATKEMAPVYQNCQDVLATCESVKRSVSSYFLSYFSAQVAFAAWLRGLGLD